MALGTNYKRNQDKSDNAIASRIAKATELAKELNGNLELASAVVLGRKTREQAIKEVGKRPGRPALPPEQAQTAMIRERVTPAQRAEYEARGRKAWLVDELNRKRK